MEFKINMSPDSKVWIYQANREFTNEEVKKITEAGSLFVHSWTAHDMPLDAEFFIKYNRFIIFVVDEDKANATGCSIDKSVNFIRIIEKEYNVSLFDRLSFAYKAGNEISSCKSNEFEELLETGVVNDETIVFNNLVSNLSELQNNWEIPLKKSWHRQLFE